MSATDAAQARAECWYNGYLYDRLISPMGRWMATTIVDLVPEKSAVLEVGCGPGNLALELSTKCQRVVAVDISKRMIEYANTIKHKRGVPNVDFLNLDASRLSSSISQHFDFAIACMCLHEVEDDMRQDIVRNCMQLSSKMIITDYKAPFPKSIVGFGNNLLEIIGGKRHHQNFKRWQALGGIDRFIKQMRLVIVAEMEWADRCGKTVVVKAS
jgi:SAM-dependent methyltransferase